jgi:2-polyprenyl-3-methyl-5-hydroxy-6-metoxy-1,4-benzoquinol methylase
MKFQKRYDQFNNREERATFISKVFSKEIESSNTVLDVGCDFNNLKHIVGSKVTGVDLYGSPDFKIDFEKEKLSQFKDREFDMIICTEVLEHLENFHEMIDEIFRVSNKYILISLPNCADFFTRLNILSSGYVGKFYGLPIEKPNDRHRWFFSHIDIEKFFLEYTKKHQYKILRRFLVCNYGSSWKGFLVRLFIRIFNINSAGQSYWILIEKK